jgi:hypothetical protein
MENDTKLADFFLVQGWSLDILDRSRKVKTKKDAVKEEKSRPKNGTKLL